MKKILYFVYILSILVFTSCEKNIGIQQQPYDSKISIQGLICEGKKPIIYINKTTPFLEPVTPNRDIFVDNANVSLTENGNSTVLEPDSSFDAFYGIYNYYYSSNELIKNNTLYSLTIVYNSETYTAQATTNQPKVTIDSITYVENFQDLYGEHEGVIFNFKDPIQQNQYYRYEMHRNVDSSTYGLHNFKSPYLMGDERTNVSEIGRTLYPDESFNGNNYSFVIEPVFKHKAGDSAYVFLQSCDENLYNFYIELDRQKLTQKNPFVEPVYLKPTQFTNAIGVFGAYSISDSVLFIYPD